MFANAQALHVDPDIEPLAAASNNEDCGNLSIGTAAGETAPCALPPNTESQVVRNRQELIKGLQLADGSSQLTKFRDRA